MSIFFEDHTDLNKPLPETPNMVKLIICPKLHVFCHVKIFPAYNLEKSWQNFGMNARLHAIEKGGLAKLKSVCASVLSRYLNPGLWSRSSYFGLRLQLQASKCFGSGSRTIWFIEN